MLITIDHLDFSYGIHTIFKDLTYSVQEKERIGLIGNNGSGKTTFFKLLCGELLPDGGSIHLTPSLTVGYLRQDTADQAGRTMKQVFMEAFTHLTAMENRMKAVQEAINHTAGQEQLDAVEELGRLQEKYQNQGGYEYPSRIRGVTTGLGFTADDLKKDIATFSGGQKTRIALGRILLQAPDLLLLDEPTNYLDFQTMDWLETFLRGYDRAFIIISHDRYFLDKVCTRITQLERHRFISFEGNYTEYTLKKQRYDQAEQDRIEKNNKEIARQQQIIDRLRAYNSVQSSKRARSREKKLERMTTIHQFEADNAIKLRFSPKIRSSDDVLTVSDLSKSFDSLPLFKDVSFEIHRCDKIGLIGPNGVGKSTLVRILLRQLLPDTGFIRYGQKVKTGYYTQEGQESQAYGDITLIDAIWQIDSQLSEGEIRNLLARFLFTGEEVYRTTESLSGGEMARLRLAMLMVSESNLLLLDEPTNHIDMPTKEILENALADYDGTILAISHDRYFLNQIANRIFVLTPDGLRESMGNYDDYYDSLQRAKSAAAEDASPQMTKTQLRNERKRAKSAQDSVRKLKRELKALEAEIEATDGAIADIERKLGDPDFFSDSEKAQAATQEYETLQEKSNGLLEKWENLALLVESDESD